MNAGSVVTLMDNRAFLAEVLGIAPSGTVFLRVISWGGETGGWRMRGVLGYASYAIEELEIVELPSTAGADLSVSLRTRQ